MQGDPVGQAPAHYGVKGVASSANVPPARSNACTWTDTSGNLWMYGGSAFSNYYSDMWMFNTAANQWTWISGDSTSKPVTYGTLGVASATNTPGGGRDNASGWRDNVGGDLWLFGGSNGSSSGNSRSFKDVWRYSIATNRWAWMGGDTTAGFPIYNTMGVASYSNIMGTRSKPAAWVDDASGKLYVSCGYDLWVGVYLNDVWTYSPSIPFPIALPLHLLSFTARREAPNNLLRWTTANEVNVDRFEIERTSNGTEFKKIGIVKAGLSNYNFTDSKPLANVNYYRIKMIDRDGKFEYSPVRQITISNSLLSIALYPNPAKDHFNLNIYTPTAQQAQVQMTDQAGKVIRQQGISLLAGENNQNIRVSDIAPGIYLLKVIYREGITQTTKWIKE